MSEENRTMTEAASPVQPDESFADALLKEAASLMAQKRDVPDFDLFGTPVRETPVPETPAPEAPAEPAVAEAAPFVQSSPEAAQTDGEGEPMPDEDDPLAELTAKKKARAKAKKAPAAPRKSSRARATVEDLGDGSGYIAPTQSVEEVVESEDEGQWYAVHCYSGQENKVKHNLEQRIETMGMAGRILKVVVPTEEELEVKDGKRRSVERRVFPGYILVKMKISEEAWFVVRNTPGVTRFVGMGNRPAPLSQPEVDQILHRMEAEAPKLKVNYRPGQKVRITDGPFADFMGMVDKIDTERAKVSVLVSFFGRDTPVELDFLQVERM